MNGVSQQPDALRFDTQCAAQENAYPSVVEGLTKRQPTEHICRTAYTGDQDTFVHTIKREDPERYTVIIREKSIRVYDQDGNEKTVEIPITAGASNNDVTYLDTATPSTSLKANTIADVTYISNSEITPTMQGTTPGSSAAHEAIVFIGQAHNSTYTMTVKQGNNSVSGSADGGETPSATAIASDLAGDINNTSSSQSYTGATSSVDFVQSDISFDKSVHAVCQSFRVSNTEPITSFTWRSDRNTLDTTYTWEILPDNSGVPNFSATPLASTTSSGCPANESKTITFSGSVFTPSTGTTYWLVRHIEILSVPRRYKPQPRGWLYNASGDYPTSGLFIASAYFNGAARTGDMWFQIHQQQSSGNNTSITAVSSGPIVYLSSPEDFSVTGTNSFSDSYIQVFKNKAQKLSALPVQAKDGMVIEIEGEPDAGIDDFYVKFVTSAAGESIGVGVWEETVGPNIENGLELSPSKMPHLLIKQTNGTFVFKPADGESHTSTGDGTPTYDYSKFAWGKRIAGDVLTNPDPTFVGNSINNMFLYKNRFGILSGENIILSEAGEYFNFFRTTVIDLLDTSVIDIASASSEVSILRHALPLSESLVILSDSAQFILQSDTALTAKTVSLARATAYNTIKNTPPDSAENSVFFAFNRGSFSGVREYLSTDLEQNYEGIDISTQIPKYIPGEITHLKAANHDSVLCCLASGDTDAVYVYNFYNSDTKRLQSAWHRWEFGSGSKIYNIDFIDTHLYLTIYREEGVFIEKLAVEIGKTDTGSDYVSRLDRRFTQSTSGVLVSGSTITMPYKKTPGRNIEVITTSGERISVASQTNGSNSITMVKDMTGVNFYAGEAYTMSYTFSDITLKEGTQTGGLAVITDGRIQVRYGTVTYSDSGFFKISVTPNFRDTSDHEFTGRILGEGTMTLGSVPLESGEFRFPVFSKADQVEITLTNDTPLPCKLLSAEYELSWNPKVRRM
tara:strand:+ start:17233 stop:20127 length:2895 start_codon:yes stop_codon:yes gene_type:complete